MSTPKYYAVDAKFALPEQEKTVEITENGTVEVTPDDGCALGKVTANVNVPTGIPEEFLVLTGDCSYKFEGGRWDSFIDIFNSSITTRDITNAEYMFHGTKITTIPFDINFIDGGAECQEMFYQATYLTNIPSIDFRHTSTAHSLNTLFSACIRVEEIGTLKNIYPKSVQSMFQGCRLLRCVPDFEIVNSAIGSFSSMFNGCRRLRTIPMSLLKELLGSRVAGSSQAYHNMFDSAWILDEIIGLPIFTKASTSNMFSNTFNSTTRLKAFTFDVQEDGSPCVVNWANQTIKLSSYVGYGQINLSGYLSGDYNVFSGDTGITRDKYVVDATTYEALKNDPDWITTGVNYSRYNHDSAVNTINSLPDTSAYLAESGGANTITFKGEAGALTDGGAINTLTEEEIAVATAKGWTVTFV